MLNNFDAAVDHYYRALELARKYDVPRIECTVLYRIGNIKKILNNELKTPDERLPYQIAFYIRSMQEEKNS